MSLDQLITSGELKKMEIYGCTDDEYSQYDPPKPITVAINPDTITTATTVVYKAEQAGGNTAANLKFEKITPTDMKFELLFDSTGVLSNQKEFLSGFKSAGEVTSVFDQIQAFRDVAFSYSSKTHKPKKLKLVWGDLIFKGVVKAWSVTYTLFQPDGTPIRAKGSLSIAESVADSLRVGEENRNSPDLTHLRVVKAGDTLPGMCQNIYGDSQYYIGVAEYNKLNNFRRLEPGTKLYFPPLADSTNS